MRLMPLAGLVLLTCTAACTTERAELGQGDAAPAWTAVTFDGTPIRFPEVLAGKPAVVVFWATWCSYCKAFMPYLRSIQADYGSDAINVLTINAKEDGSGNPENYITALGFPMIAVRDGDAIASSYDVEYIPGLMVVDATGTVAYRRAWTELPASDSLANLWSIQVRSSLNKLLD